MISGMRFSLMDSGGNRKRFDRELWGWIQFIFPEAKSVALEPLGLRMCPYRQEVGTVLTSRDIKMVGFYGRLGYSSVRGHYLEKLSSVGKIGLFGVRY